MDQQEPLFPIQAHILHCEGADPVVDRIVRENDRMRMIIVFVSNVADTARVAADLVERDGVQLIELDGGLGAICTADVVKAVAGRAAVGAAMFGAESLKAAAAYGARYEDQKR